MRLGQQNKTRFVCKLRKNLQEVVVQGDNLVRARQNAEMLYGKENILNVYEDRRWAAEQHELERKARQQAEAERKQRQIQEKNARQAHVDVERQRYASQGSSSQPADEAHNSDGLGLLGTTGAVLGSLFGKTNRKRLSPEEIALRTAAQSAGRSAGTEIARKFLRGFIEGMDSKKK